MAIWSKLSARERAIVYILSAVLLISVIYNFIMEPALKQFKGVERSIKLANAKLQKAVSVIKDKDNIDKEYSLYAEKLKAGGSDEQEITTVLNELEIVARNANLKLVSMKPKPAQDKGFYRKFSVDIETESDMGSLMRFIYEVKNSQLFLKVERLSLNTKTGQAGLPGQQAGLPDRQAGTAINASMSISKISLK